MLYYVNWVLTNAQIELIAADVSVVDYGSCKSGKNGKKKSGEHDSTPASLASIERANAEWLQRYGNSENAGKGLSVKDIFGGSVSEVGVKLS